MATDIENSNFLENMHQYKHITLIKMTSFGNILEALREGMGDTIF